jgi:hypothetical protein
MTDEEEYRKFQTPDEYARRLALVQKGIESAKQRSEQKRRMIEMRRRKMMRKDLAERYGV